MFFFFNPQAHNNLSDNLEIVRGILCAGFFPSIIQCKQKRRGKRIHTHCYTKEDGHVILHPASVNSYLSSFPYPWLVYNEKVKTTSIYIIDSSNISDYAVLMFGGSLTPNKTEDGIEMLGGYLQFSATKRIAKLVQVGHSDFLIVNCGTNLCAVDNSCGVYPFSAFSGRPERA